MKSLYDYIAPRQWIFTIVKPGFLDHTQDIITMFGDEGWEVDRMTVKTLTLSEARDLYKVHKDKEFYDDLCDYMSSGPSRAIIYKKKGTLTSDTYKEVGVLKDAIRERWGIDESKNVMHSSDSLPAAQHESSIYF
jgi:nucleoside-diphosphate kinase